MEPPLKYIFILNLIVRASHNFIFGLFYMCMYHSIKENDTIDTFFKAV